jgi:hypothetical protein
LERKQRTHLVMVRGNQTNPPLEKTMLGNNS